MTGELFKQRAGIDMLHVPYKGSAPAIQDLLAGNVQAMFDNLPTVLPLVRAGKLRALAVTGAQRSPELPDIPTIAEAGLPGFDTSAWFALLERRTVPPEVRHKIEADTIAALTADDTRGRLAAVGIMVAADGAGALDERITRETAMWRAVVAKAGIKPQ
jgi:tripartite-type tricarboxylate transporter receptor subunit TctC